ncbi:hypothetical protein AAF712_001540 [Marasmius tenuissimus]|uniref:Uncharacterized protein n=1 Tax=Marasmius tenuissimus TaxID=585030 RepID=A0ABR3AD89_9AGAR
MRQEKASRHPTEFMTTTEDEGDASTTFDSGDESSNALEEFESDYDFQDDDGNSCCLDSTSCNETLERDFSDSDTDTGNLSAFEATPNISFGSDNQDFTEPEDHASNAVFDPFDERWAELHAVVKDLVIAELNCALPYEEQPKSLIEFIFSARMVIDSKIQLSRYPQPGSPLASETIAGIPGN